MLASSPINHTHYFCLALPLAMGATAMWQQTGGRRLGAALFLVGLANVVAERPSLVPGLATTCDYGAVLYGALLFWLTGVLFLRQARLPGATLLEAPAVAARAA